MAVIMNLNEEFDEPFVGYDRSKGGKGSMVEESKGNVNAKSWSVRANFS